MTATTPHTLSSNAFSLYLPKLVTVLNEGYPAAALRRDALAGLTVAIVALPLSMAIAIGSGLSPEKGLFTAIVGGFLISALGGSRFQIGGPAGAFIVLIASIVERHGYDGLLIATLIAGLIMIAAGLLRLGSTIKFIPLPVTIGFTAGIAVIIFASQLREFFGLTLVHEPAALVPKLEALWDVRSTLNPAALFLAGLSLSIILILRRVRPAWPGLLIAVVAATVTALIFDLDIATIGSRFGALPRILPTPAFPPLDPARLQALLPDAFSIALLGSIESLLSAVVADSMTGRRHRSNGELVAQGVANIASAACGGMCATGTIARTATNIRAGAHGPLAGIFHALYLLLFMLIAAPLAAYIPLAALAGILAAVAWSMAEKEEFWGLLRASPYDALLLLLTFLLTVFVDLTTAIATGAVLGAFLFLHRLSAAIAVEKGLPLFAEDLPDSPRSPPDNAAVSDHSNIAVYRFSGPLFFGGTAAIGNVLHQIDRPPRALVLDFSAVPLADSSAARALKHALQHTLRQNIPVFITGASASVRRDLAKAGLSLPVVRYADTPERIIESHLPR